jgi:hypothetical protein
MKKRLLLLACCCLITVASHGQDEAMEMSEEMKVWMEYMTPGPVHKMLASANGEWNTKTSYWTMPGAEAQVSMGSCTNEMILGGRYQKSTHRGHMMGMPFEGISLLAYDNATEQFYTIWIDNVGTGMMMSRGKLNYETNTAEVEGSYVDPMTGMEQPVRQTYRMIDDNTHVLEMFMSHEGQEFKALVVEYTRK